MICGSWYMLGDDAYVIVNAHGTVEKLGKPKWNRILALLFLQFFGKKQSILEIKEYLFGGNA